MLKVSAKEPAGPACHIIIIDICPSWTFHIFLEMASIFLRLNNNFPAISSAQIFPALSNSCLERGRAWESDYGPSPASSVASVNEPLTEVSRRKSKDMRLCAIRSYIAACLTDKLQSIVCSRLSSGGWDAWRFLAISRQVILFNNDQPCAMGRRSALSLLKAASKSASELRKQQIITGSFLWSTGSLRVYNSLTNGTETRERDKFKHT
ncbi:hypothetical protein T11_14747 [Trichinella zimbabwensis]|uniref:Uncharacterized protein n=1 Tax=Trichinella zimbabwensis TaxID=268475 RepID=A0A0V1HEA8_9BILA|nr:hypothetical protein T11_14747 [Trichinella zimbabwensis]